MEAARSPAEGGSDDLDARIRGDALGPGDPGYDAAREIWNARLARRPAIIARCAGVADVRDSLAFARERDLEVAVRGGGHSYAGDSTCDDGLLVDLSAMGGVRVDPRARTVRVGPGATWAACDHETRAFGLATTGATVSSVGVSGYVLGGGTGYLARSCGLGADNLLSADVVTAEGELVRASESRNPDLFWGLRGAGAKLGVVTSFELRLHELATEVLAGMVVHRFEAAGEVLRSYRSLMAEAPDEVICYPFFIHLPEAPVFPEELHGRTVLALVPAYMGPVAEGEEALRPFRSLGDPVFDGVAPQPYTRVQKSFDAGVPKGMRWYTKAHFLDAASDGAIETILSHVEELPGALSMVYLEPMGGRIGRVDPDATAFPHRDAAYGFHVLAGWRDPGDDDRIMEWARGFHEAMSSFATGGVYVNLLGEDEEDRMDGAYGANLQRLRRVTEEWDPDGIFR